MKHFLILLSASLLSMPALSDFQSSHHLDEISVDGQFSTPSYNHAPRQQSRSEQLREQRAQLEKQNEQMIQQRIEDVRYQNEKALMQQMQEAMNQAMQALENI